MIKPESIEETVSAVKMKVSPFAETPYETQLQNKKDYILDLLKNIKEIGRKNCNNSKFFRIIKKYS